jgi:hypothetical protein
MTKTGQIKFDGVSAFSATRARDHAACLGRLRRVAGYPLDSVFGRGPWPARKEEGFVVIVTAYLPKLLVSTPENRLTQDPLLVRTKTEHR